jgi:monoamine oxidase
MDSKVFYEPYPQSAHQLVQVPPNNDPSFRVIGGTTAMIDALAQALDPNDIYCYTAVALIKKLEDHFEIQTNQKVFTADILISTLPPNLLNESIVFETALPIELTQVASLTHTWMSESIKIGLRYKQPFWRENGSSGTVFSNVGPITELYDHSNNEDKLYALKGFVKDEYSQVSQAERLELIMIQLQKFYGKQAKDYLSYEETVWRDESFTHNFSRNWNR